MTRHAVSPVVLGGALALALAPLGVGAAACTTSSSSLPPTDAPVFPTGVAVTPDGSHLLVVSSNFDLAHDFGALFLADLGKATPALTGDGSVVVNDAYVAHAIVPSFGDKPVFTSDGLHAFVPTRGTNQVLDVDVSTAPPGLVCGTTDCGQGAHALQLPASDPLNVVITHETNTGAALTAVDGLITLEASPDVYFFHDDFTKTGADRMTLTGFIHLGDDVGGVHGAVLRPARDGDPDLVIVSLERAVLQSDGSTLHGAELDVFEPRPNVSITKFDLSGTTGALATRDLVLVPGGAGLDDDVVVQLRSPEALARVTLGHSDDGLVTPRLSGLAASCKQPTSLLRVPAAILGHERLLQTCQLSEAIELVDPLTLAPLDAVRFFGRSPYAVTVKGTTAFVSFFLDNSIGVLSMQDDDGTEHLRARGRVGAQAAPPEDGRQ
jgi:hypothetical protein